MTANNRRHFLKTAGVSLGALALGPSTTGADSTQRFVVDKRGLQTERGMEVVHDLSPVDLLVVKASEDALDDAGVAYAPDGRYSPRLPDTVSSRSRVEYPPEGETLFEYQWDKQDQRIPETHETTRGEGTRVAIIDSGIGAEHPDLRHAVNAELSRNFTEDSLGAPGPYGGAHGTHVAGSVAASDRTDSGVIGSAPGTELVDLRVFSEVSSSGFSAWMGDVLAAIVYSAELGADAANLSLGWTFRFRDDGWGQFWGKAMQRTTTYANRNGTVLTHACGNWGGTLQFDEDQRDSSETAGGLTVSATGPIGFEWGDEGLEQPPYAPAFYTNYGTNAVDLGAPGGNADLDAIGTDEPWYYDYVLNTVAVPEFDDETGEYLGATYGYDWYAGTSMAAPQVAGAVALVKSAKPRLDANQAKNALERVAEVPDEYERKYYGSGYLDTYRAVTN
ncbi:S8 family peptidase [Halorussus salinisoli]|uniref:S8 family peptidase n=1 Tax=Halorussus salinisoli TaxID=2558242 RepID=UPI0010C23CD5|nr:S8 family serine peptidase [Halorussus salinisoli]